MKQNLSRGWCRINLPYCLVKLQRQGHIWLPLNRNYKPLGYPYAAWVHYNDFLHQAIRFHQDPMTFTGVWWVDRYGETHAPYFYNDGNESRTDYFERYQRLLSRSVKVPLEQERHLTECYLPTKVAAET